VRDEKYVLHHVRDLVIAAQQSARQAGDVPGVRRVQRVERRRLAAWFGPVSREPGHEQQRRAGGSGHLSHHP